MMKPQIKRWENEGGATPQEAAKSAVLIDIGNTKTALGYVVDGVIQKTWKLTTHKHLQADEYIAKYAHFLQEFDVTIQKEKICVASVVPHITEELKSKKDFHLHFIDFHSPIDFTIERIEPEHLGSDIIAASQAAVSKYQGNLIVIDAGTATTVTVINEKKEFLGGAICPGLGISADALYKNASALSSIELSHPLHTIGNSTQTALLSGIILGHAHMICGLVESMKQEADFQDPKVLFTGGTMEWLQPHFPEFYIAEPNLTLEGIYQIACKL